MTTQEYIARLERQVKDLQSDLKMAMETIESQRQKLAKKTKAPSRARRRIRPKFPDTQYGKAQAQAWKRKIDWALSQDQYHTLTANSCSYCNGPLGDNGIRLDRLNNELGYSADNVVPCCYRCNMVKGRHLDQETMKRVGAILNCK